MKQLILENFLGLDENQIKEIICNSYGIQSNFFKNKEIIVAYQAVAWFDSGKSEYVLFKDKINGKFYENHGNYCPCYGFELNWNPIEVNNEYLINSANEESLFWNSGYDNNFEENIEKVKNFFLYYFKK